MIMRVRPKKNCESEVDEETREQTDTASRGRGVTNREGEANEEAPMKNHES